MKHLTIEERIKRIEYIINQAEWEDVLSPINYLLISQEWTSTDLDKCYDLFKKYDRKWSENNGKGLNTQELENEYIAIFGGDYKSFRLIIKAFWEGEQFKKVCWLFALGHNCIEFHEITNEKEPAEFHYTI